MEREFGDMGTQGFGSRHRDVRTQGRELYWMRERDISDVKKHANAVKKKFDLCCQLI